jgi:hypothetical protein
VEQSLEILVAGTLALATFGVMSHRCRELLMLVEPPVFECGSNYVAHNLIVEGEMAIELIRYFMILR